MREGVRFWLEVVYLALAGWVCVLVPWSRGWLAWTWSLPPAWAQLLSHPALRGAISGFGVLHLLVALGFATKKERTS
ncbi:MAG: hypothetical protein KatS3mg007_2239 [Thermoanaerobaculum sp.]|uniref:DUF4405 domain-containing protein n=1 Tax=Thermoanaerobaculum aquaticum TaxID=1312852 RepID=A0A7C2NA23_9BACT|nr:MAG: hypothetical protein KatS3mg007_2239 [Thermoanaerobaculum sp.]